MIQMEKPKTNYDPRKQIGPYNTPDGLYGTNERKRQKDWFGDLLLKVGSTVKKYLPLKKTIREHYKLK